MNAPSRQRAGRTSAAGSNRPRLAPASRRGAKDPAGPGCAGPACDLRAAFDAATRERDAHRVALERMQDRLGLTSRFQAYGEMASGVAHDCNNALTTILGLSDWLVHEMPEGAPYRADIETIRTAAQDAAAIVRRLQVFGRVTPNHARPDAQELVDLGDTARVVADLVRPRCQELALRTGLTYDVVVDAKVGPTVLGIAAEIRELLVNLAFNGLDAMPGGGVLRIAARLDHDRPTVTVTDGGTGVPAEIKARIFEPFFSTKGVQGSGLGLSVCAGIAQRHHASLTVADAIGGGSIFALAFPEISGPVTPAPAGGAASPVTAIRPLEVLVVDDEPDVCESLAAMTAALGHHVTTAANGRLALAESARHTFDVVVTDLGMPGMSGLELARLVAARSATPVIMVTAWGIDFGAQPPAGVSMVVPKPVTMRGLQQALAAVTAPPPGHEPRRARPVPRAARVIRPAAHADVLDGMEAS
jgi:signal transduction histidine kinase/ActR/RegA family two-component response regulator